MEKDTDWVCPKCDKLLNYLNQEHYCIPASISFYLDKCPVSARKLLDILNTELQSFGFYEIFPANSSLHYKARYVFLTIRFKSDSLELEFQSKSEKIITKTNHSVKIAKGRYMHKIDLSKITELDQSLYQSLYNSYTMNSANSE